MDTRLPSETDSARGRLWLATQRAAGKFLADGALTSGAAMSFYLALCLAPLAMVTLAVIELLWGEPADAQHIINQAQQFVGAKGAATMSKMISAADTPDTGVGSLLTGVLVGLFGATGVFVHLQQTLDCIYEVSPDPNRGRAQMVWDRLVSFVMVALIGVLLLVSLLVTAALAALSIRVQAHVPTVAWLGQVWDFFISLAIMSFLFACIFKFLPHTEIAWRKVWLGALVTALLFNVGKELTGLYLGLSGVDSASEAAGALVALVIWEYYSSLTVFFGAELTKAYMDAADQDQPAHAGSPKHLVQ